MDDQELMRLAAARTMQDDYEPPDTAEWVRALEGCAELYRHAAEHLSADRYLEAVRCLTPALRMGDEVHRQALFAFLMSGEAGEQMLDEIRRHLGDTSQRGER